MTIDQLWRLFEETGDISYYLFYKALQDKKYEDENMSIRDDVPLDDMN
ncbi:MAG: hypothetical protein PWQ93_140 [Clostridiales bacterium]|nr:hypothetical protein [Clostridiales bacterium]